MTGCQRPGTRLPTLVAMVLAFAGCAGPRADDGDAPASPSVVDGTSGVEASGTSARKTVELMDTAWPGAPMAFATIEVPADWRATGGIAVPPAAAVRAGPEPQLEAPGYDPYAAGDPGSPTQCQAMPLTCLDWSAGRSDGSQGIAILPSASWFVDVPPARRQAPPTAPIVQGALLALARLRHPDARLVAFAPVDVPPPPEGNAPSFPTRWESGRLVVAYRQDGHDMREESTTVLAISETELLEGSGQRLMVTRNPPVAVYASAARFDALDRDRIRASMTMVPAWWERLNEQTAAREAARQAHTCNQAIHHPRPRGCAGTLPAD